MSSSARVFLLGTMLVIFLTTTGGGYLFLIERNQLTHQNVQLSQQLDHAAEENQSLQSGIEKARIEKIQLERDYEALEQEHASVLQDRDVLDIQIEALAHKNNLLSERLQAMRASLAKALGDQGDLVRRLDEAEEKASVQLPRIVVRGQSLPEEMADVPEEGEISPDPVVARIVSINKKHRFVVIDAGILDGVGEGMRFSIVNDKEETLGHAEVVEIRDRVAALSLTEDSRRRKIKEGFSVTQEL